MRKTIIIQELLCCGGAGGGLTASIAFFCKSVVPQLHLRGGKYLLKRH